MKTSRPARYLGDILGEIIMGPILDEMRMIRDVPLYKT